MDKCFDVRIRSEHGFSFERSKVFSVNVDGGAEIVSRDGAVMWVFLSMVSRVHPHASHDCLLF